MDQLSKANLDQVVYYQSKKKTGQCRYQSSVASAYPTSSPKLKAQQRHDHRGKWKQESDHGNREKIRTPNHRFPNSKPHQERWPAQWIKQKR